MVSENFIKRFISRGTAMQLALLMPSRAERQGSMPKSQLSCTNLTLRQTAKSTFWEAHGNWIRKSEELSCICLEMSLLLSIGCVSKNKYSSFLNTARFVFKPQICKSFWNFRQILNFSMPVPSVSESWINITSSRWGEIYHSCGNKCGYLFSGN